MLFRSYTPNPSATGGSATITINLQDNGGTANGGVDTSGSQTFVINVQVPPQFTSAASTTFAPGKTSQTFNVTASGFPSGGSISFSAGSGFPSAVTLTDNHNGTATISGTPAAHTQDTTPYHATITASNGVSPDATENFTLNIVCPAISITNGSSSASLIYNTAITPFTYMQSGGNGTIQWSATGLPTGLSIDQNSGQLSGTPTITGTFAASIIATDAGACTGSKAVSVMVGPKLQTQSYTGVGNTQFFITGASGAPGTPAVTSGNGLLTNASPADTMVTTASCTSGGTLTAVDAAGHFIFTPDVSATSATCTYTASSNTGPGSSGPAAVSASLSFTLNNKVWYVNSSGSNGDGRSNTPFNSMTGADTASASGDYVFVHTGNTSTGTPGTISLAANQTLWGQGTTFTLGPLTIASGTKPKLTGTVTLGGNNITVSSLDLSTGGTTGLTNTGTITGATVENGVTVTTTTGTAVSLSNAGGTFTFTSITAGTAASGPTNGILLTNTTGSFTIAGNGGTCSTAANCTGGAIQKTSGAGISMTNAQSISIDRMFIQNTALSGVSGTGVVNFTFTNGRIDLSGNGSAPVDDASNIGFGFQPGVNPANNNVSGTVTITGNTLTNAYEHGIDIQNFSGTISNALIQNNTLTSDTNAANTHGSAIRLLGLGSTSVVSSITKATISGNTITNFPGGAGITSQYGNVVSGGPAGTWGTPGSPTNFILIQSNLIKGQSNANPLNANAVLGTLFGAGQAAWKIDSNGTAANPIQNVCGTAIGVSIQGPSVIATADITNNHIVGFPCVGAQAISYSATYFSAPTDAPTLSGTISGNVISGQDGNGIIVLAFNNSKATVNASILNNNIGTPNNAGNEFGILVASGSSSQTDPANAPTVCMNMQGNTSAGSGVDTGIGIRKRTPSAGAATPVFNIQGYSSGAVDSYVAGLNPNGGGVTLISATTGFGSCTAP